MVEIGPIKFGFSPEDKFRDIFRSIQDDNSQNTILKNRVMGIGKSLYDELFPASLKALYWQKRDEKKEEKMLKSIRVITKEPWIPWEIIKPWRELPNGNIEEDPFLCEQYSFARWVVTTNTEEDKRYEQIRHLPIKEIKVVVPSDTPLINAKNERDWIVKRFQDDIGIHVSVDSSYEQVVSSLTRGGFDILHFSTHGRYNAKNPMSSSVELEKRIDLRPTDISGSARKFGANNPIVILNACQTGGQGFSLTGVQSWARRFLEAGSPVFISTLWSVSDDVAFIFAKELYAELCNGTTLGEAVRRARNKSKNNGDPSWLAYQLYGHPNSKITFA
jgi:hypothetical protein